MCKSETPKGLRATQVPGGTGAPTAPAGRRGAGGLLGAPAAQCPFLPRRIPRVPSPAAGLGLRSPEAFRTRAIKEPPLSLSAPLAPLPPALPSPDPLTGEEGRWGGRRGGNLSPPPLPKSTTLSVPAGQACSREQRGTLFSAVVSWPFDLSAAGEMLLLTFG